jgi:hypothetical protein
MREHGGRGRSKQEEGSMGGRKRYCACGGKFGTWLRRMLPPPTNNRASEAEGGGRAMADRKSVEEGGRTGMEYLRRKKCKKRVVIAREIQIPSARCRIDDPDNAAAAADRTGSSEEPWSIMG